MAKKLSSKDIDVLSDEEVITSLHATGKLSERARKAFENRINKIQGDLYMEASSLLHQRTRERDQKPTEWHF